MLVMFSVGEVFLAPRAVCARADDVSDLGSDDGSLCWAYVIDEGLRAARESTAVAGPDKENALLFCRYLHQFEALPGS